jgi:hypothetical protein
MSEAVLTDAEREALAEALPDALTPVGALLKWHPATFRGRNTALERTAGTYGQQILDALEPSVTRIKAAARAEVEAKVLALADEWSTPESHREGAYIRERDAADRIRAALSDSTTGGEDRPLPCSNHTEYNPNCPLCNLQDQDPERER